MFLENTISSSSTVDSLFSTERRPTPSLQTLFDRQPIETFEAGEAIFWEGDAATHVFEVSTGVLRVCRLLSDGRRAITGFLYPGDLVGVSLKDRYLYTAEAVTETKVRRFARGLFQEKINECPALRPQLFARLCDEMAAAQDQLVLLGRKSAEERVSSFLLAIARRLSSDRRTTPVVEIPMTRLDMADYLGLTIETVSRTMTSLAARGVIAANGRHAVVVRKLAKLVALAGETEADDKYPITASTRQAVWPH